MKLQVNISLCIINDKDFSSTQSSVLGKVNPAYIRAEIKRLQDSLRHHSTIKSLLQKYNAWNAEPQTFPITNLFHESGALRERSAANIAELRKSIVKFGGSYSKE
jgi:hypothetical protein